MTVGVENEAVGRCFIYDPATRPFVIFGGENGLREAGGNERPAPEGLPLLPAVVVTGAMCYAITVLLSVV